MIYFTKPVQWTIAVSETEEKFEVFFYREEDITYNEGHGTRKKTTMMKLITKNTATGKNIAARLLCATMITQQLTNQIITMQIPSDSSVMVTLTLCV